MRVEWRYGERGSFFSTGVVEKKDAEQACCVMFFLYFCIFKFSAAMEDDNIQIGNPAASYDDDSIVHLEDMEHIRLRPGMYIGKLGDGSSHDDGIYVLIKEVIDNAIDEFTSGFGKRIDMTINFSERKVSIRDYGRGIPLLKMVEAVSKLNTGAKYDSKVFQKSVGLNGVGTKAVNALSSWFKVQSFRDGKTRCAEFCEGELTSDSDIIDYRPDSELEATGTLVEFVPDSKLFGNYHFISEYVERRVWNYCYLNRGLTFYYNGNRYYSKNGLLDLLEHNMEGEPLYPVIHIKDEDFEAAFTHVNGQNSDYYYSFVNGQHTTEGGTHQSAFREGYARPRRIYARGWYAPCVCVFRSRCLKRRPKPNLAPPIWLPIIKTAATIVHTSKLMCMTFSNATSTTTSTCIATPPTSCLRKSSATRESARALLASRSWPRRAARRQASTTASCATAMCITTAITSAGLKALSSLPRVFRPAAALPRAVMWRHRRCLACGESR